jgi:hypothetical protein
MAREDGHREGESQSVVSWVSLCVAISVVETAGWFSVIRRPQRDDRVE